MNIHLKIFKFEREKEQMRGLPRTCSLPPNVYNTHGTKAESQELEPGLHWVAGTQLLELSLLPSRICISRKPTSRAAADY